MLKEINYKKLALALCLILTIGFLYAFVAEHWLSLSCPIYIITGLFCPGCGITSMSIALINGNIIGAYNANPVLFITLPIIIYILLKLLIYYAAGKKAPITKTEHILIIIVIILLVGYNLFRNFIM